MKNNFVYYAVPCVLALYAFRKFREYRWGWCKNKVKLTQKISIVTGANSGIGFEVASELLRRDAIVILACRSYKKGEETIVRLRKRFPLLPSGRLYSVPLDLTSVTSIKNFAEEVGKLFNRVHILINNAGVAYPDGEKIVTQDGFEIHFGVNHLGHFLLTNLLLPLLEREPDQEKSRIVILTSKMHERGSINLNDLNYNAPVPVKNAYSNSKLANVYFAQELAKHVSNKGINVYTVCPGFVYTSLFRHYNRMMMKYILFLLPVAFCFMRTPKQGAQTIIYCLTEPSLVDSNGKMYRDCKLYESKHKFSEVTGQELWKASMNLLKPFKVL